MSYYPKSQIKTNLYSNGPDSNLTLLNPQQQLTNIVNFYTGPYYETSNGSKFTGKSPEDGKNNQLFEVNPYVIEDTPLFPEDYPNQIIINPLNPSQYSSPTPIPFSRNSPTPIQTLPTQKDKDLGSFPRYFCKKTNENYYIEINKEQFTKLQNRDTTIAWDLYTPLQVIWQIKGDKTQTSNANKNNITLIEQRNKWYGFTKYFKDNFLKYFQSPTINDLYTSGGEFTTQNGQNYIGYYHLYEGTLPMVGKNHLSTPHEVLIPVINPSGPFIPQPNQKTNLSTPITSPTYRSNSSNIGGGGGY